MTITPVELHHIQLKRGLFGYRSGPVDKLIEEIERSFEETWRERADYADRIEQLQSDLARHRDLETLLRTTLVSAEKSAHELKAQAKKEADLVIDEAHAEARAVTRAAAAERVLDEGEIRERLTVFPGRHFPIVSERIGPRR